MQRPRSRDDTSNGGGADDEDDTELWSELRDHDREIRRLTGELSRVTGVRMFVEHALDAALREDRDSAAPARSAATVPQEEGQCRIF